MSIRQRLVVNYSGGVTGPASQDDTSAAPTLVTGGDAVQVTMALTASGAVWLAGAPGTLAVNGLDGASANVNPANCGTAQLTSADRRHHNANDPITYVDTYGAGRRQRRQPHLQRKRPVGTAAARPFAAATSNGVLVSPALSYQAKVVDPDVSGLGEIVNTAYIQDTTVIPLTKSNEVTTTLPVGSIGVAFHLLRQPDQSQRTAGRVKRASRMGRHALPRGNGVPQIPPSRSRTTRGCTSSTTCPSASTSSRRKSEDGPRRVTRDPAAGAVQSAGSRAHGAPPPASRPSCRAAANQCDHGGSGLHRRARCWKDVFHDFSWRVLWRRQVGLYADDCATAITGFRQPAGHDPDIVRSRWVRRSCTAGEATTASPTTPTTATSPPT
ncbi:MAG: hypothetical protein R3A10_16105 [Caldilineaceae bacterium]